MGLVQTAKKRGVFRAAATYLIVSWLVLEVGHLLSLILELPHATMKVVLGALVLGFPLVIGMTWYFRLTADGLVPEIDLPETEPASRAEHDNHEAHEAHGGGHGGHGGGGGADPLPIILGVLTLAGLILLGAIKYFGGGHGEAAPKAEVAIAPAPTAVAAPRAAPPNSVAVLAFDNLSGDPSQAYFSDGVAEELRGQLASVAGLQVAARTSSNAFKGSTADAGTIASKLGVAYIIDGSVRRSNNVVRISAQLVEGKSGYERWSQSYDRKLTDLFATQSEIAKTVTGALSVKLLPQDSARLAAGATTSTAAHDAYLKGRQLFDLSGDEAVYRAALAQFDAAIAADPGYGAAHAARARALAAIAGQFDSADQARPDGAAAVTAAERAVALAPGLADAQSALGFVLERVKFDLPGARAAYDKSLAAGGGDADILIRYGLFNARVGDLEKGLAALDKAVTLDRFNPRAWRAYGAALFAARRYADALPRQLEAVRLSPGLAAGHAAIGDTLLMMGNIAGARAEYATEHQRWAHLAGLAIVERRQGNAAAADKALAALITEDGDTAIYQQAQVRAQWGDRAGALAALDKAFAVHDPGLLYLRRDPLLDPLRGDAHFKALAAQMAA